MSSNLENNPKLSIVGAGPGDPELITLKAVNALRSADVVLYDHLANKALLDYCHPLCEKLFVGKKGHEKSITQDSINYLIVDKAYQRGHVVRLKGGDPFIFGRGSEEINFAQKRGVEANYIPGISSINAIGTAGIPLTERGVSDGFWVITGHKSDGSLSKDITLAAQSSATVVILMGMSKLKEIVSIFSLHGKGELSAAIIQNATKSVEKRVIGKVATLESLVIKNEIANPAVIVIGEVVNALTLSKLEQTYSEKLAC